MAQLELLAAEPLVAPAGVLLRPLQDQVPRRGRERGPPRPTASGEGCPLAADEFAMPAQETRRSDGERRPAGTGEAPAQGGEDEPVALILAAGPPAQRRGPAGTRMQRTLWAWGTRGAYTILTYTRSIRRIGLVLAPRRAECPSSRSPRQHPAGDSGWS